MNIPISEIPSTSNLIADYLNQEEATQSLYNRNLSWEAIDQQSEEKLQQYNHRSLLASVIREQMSTLQLSETQHQNLSNLAKDNTCTLTTGHQLNLFSGPVYFIYKIAQTAAWAHKLNQRSQKYSYVPIFWMASEDHDFEEINHCFLNNQKIEWETHQKGAVGRFRLENIEKAKTQLFEAIGDAPFSNQVKETIEKAYQKEHTLAQATRLFVHELCKKWGILILDADDSRLKSVMKEIFIKEITQNTLWNATQPTLEYLKAHNYKLQANPREINLFYISKNGERNRLIADKYQWRVLEQNSTFSHTQLVKELDTHPERFSPNVLMRPLYQENILPNIMYIGGAGEIAYWLELKAYFEKTQTPFPILQVRNSFLWLSQKDLRRMTNLGLKESDLIKEKAYWEKKVVHNFSMMDLELEKKRTEIQKIYTDLIQKSEKTDKSLKNLLLAQEKKQLKAFDLLEKRLIKAEKRIHHDKLQSMDALYQSLNPKGKWQERVYNIFEWYPTLGTEFLLKVYDAMSYNVSMLNISKL